MRRFLPIAMFPPAWAWALPLIPLMVLYESTARLSGPERISWYAGILILGAAVLTRICRIQKQFDIFEPLHLTFALFLIFYPIRALLAVWLDESWFEPSQKNIWLALSGSALGYLCFALGYKLTPTFRLREGRLDRPWNLHRAKTASRVFLFLGLAGFIAATTLGGSLFYFISLDPSIKAPGTLSPWFFYLFWICTLMQVGSLIQLGRWLSTGQQTFLTIIYFLLALLSTVLLARYVTVLFLMMAATCWHYRKRPIGLKQLTAICLLLTVYLGLAGLYREWISPNFNLQETGELVDLAAQQDKLVTRYIVGNLENLANLSDVIRLTPSEMPYQFGLTFTPILLKPIPRVLISQKPLGASAVFTRALSRELYESGFVTTTGAWGEWYLNFSWLGLSLGMALTGAISAAAYKKMKATNSMGRVLTFSCFLVMLFTWLRGDFNSGTTYYLYYAVPMYLGLRYATRTQLL